MTMGNSVRNPAIDPAELASDPVTGMTLTPRHQENFEAPRAPEPEQPVNPPANSTPSPKISHPEALAAFQAAQQALAERRNAVRSLTETVRQRRGDLLNAVLAFQAGSEGTPEQRRQQALRDYVNTSTAERARRAALYGNGTSATANAFVRRQTAVPPGVNPNDLRKGGGRGAAPASYRGRVVPGSPADLAQQAARAARMKQP